MKKITTKTSFILPIIFNIIFMSLPSAAKWNDKDKACDINPDAAMCQDSSTSAPELVVSGLNIVIGVIGVIAVISLIVSGYRYVTARGDPGALEKARNGIIFSVAGLVVALLSFAVVNFVSSNIG